MVVRISRRARCCAPPGFVGREDVRNERKQQSTPGCRQPFSAISGQAEDSIHLRNPPSLEYCGHGVIRRDTCRMRGKEKARRTTTNGVRACCGDCPCRHIVWRAGGSAVETLAQATLLQLRRIGAVHPGARSTVVVEGGVAPLPQVHHRVWHRSHDFAYRSRQLPRCRLTHAAGQCLTWGFVGGYATKEPIRGDQIRAQRGRSPGLAAAPARKRTGGRAKSGQLQRERAAPVANRPAR